jgi:hypothetical protein
LLLEKSMSVVAENKGVAADSSRSRRLYSVGIAVVVLLLAINMVTIQRQTPWEDEIFAVSTGWSLAHARPPILSVLEQYPRTGSPIRFYGPVSFEAEALLIKLFGLSATVWRLACFAGVLLTVLVSWSLVKVAGGDKWARLITALIVALSGSLNGPLGGRWDFVTAGLFFCGLLLFLYGLAHRVKALLGWSALGGVLIGFSLASSPRTLTLVLSVLCATVLASVCFPGLWKRLTLGSLTMLAVAVLVQTLLLLPWGENSISWYFYLKQATRGDTINATPIFGRGAWNLQPHHHKSVIILCLLLGVISLYGALKQQTFRISPAKTPPRLFLTFFAVVNLSLMMLLLANALGQAPFWLPPIAAALAGWVDWEFPQDRRSGLLAVSLMSVSLLLLFLQEAQQLASVMLTWERRSTARLETFVAATVPGGAVVYGPIGGYFYPVELAGRKYLYVYEWTTPGLYSESRSSAGDKLDAEICAHPAYAMWPKMDPVQQSQEQPMPEPLSDRLGDQIGELQQPPLSPWKAQVLNRIGEVAGKYGFPDVLIYSLKAAKPCPDR